MLATATNKVIPNNEANQSIGLRVNAVYKKQHIDINYSHLDLAHLQEPTLGLLLELINRYSDLFTSDEEVLTSTSKVKHRIITENVPPINICPYRVPYHQKNILQDEIDRLLRERIIRPSSSPWSAPVVLVVKELPDGQKKVRMCIDYRALNAVTKQDYYPLPNLQETLDYLGNCDLFSTFDVKSAYHQNDMEEAIRKKRCLLL